MLFCLAVIGVIPPESAGEVMFGLKLGMVDLVINTLMTLPYSRLMEKEADLLGLETLVLACVPPAASVSLWSAFAEGKHAGGRRVPEFLSTHPASEKRAKYLQDELPKKQAAYDARCGAAADFKAKASSIFAFSNFSDVK